MIVKSKSAKFLNPKMKKIWDAGSLKALRGELGLTQQQMALELGYTDGRMIRRLENGEIPIHKQVQIIIKLKWGEG